MSPKCPYCKEKLEYTELHHSQYKGNYYYETWEGYCPECNKTFFWDEIYNFSRCDNLEEVKELE